MALEDTIKALTAAIERLTLETQNLMALRADAVETVKTAAAAAPAAAPKATKAPKETAAAAPTAAAEKTDAEKELERKIAAAEAHPVGSLVLKYMKGFDEADPKAAEERDARLAQVKGIYEKVQNYLRANGQPDAVVNSFSDIPENLHPTVVDALTKFLAAGNLVIGKTAPLAL